MNGMNLNPLPLNECVGVHFRWWRVRSSQGHYLETGTGGVNSTWCDTAAAARILSETEANDLIRRGVASVKEAV